MTTDTGTPNPQGTGATPPAGGAGAPTPPPAGGSPGSFDFRQHLSEEYKGKYTEFKDIDSVFKGYDGLVKKLGSNPIVVPGEAATQAEKDAFNTRINQVRGVPESADKYEVTVPKELPEGFIKPETMKGMMDVFHKAGVGKDQAHAIMNAYFSEETQAYNDTLARVTQEKTTAETALKEKWGDKYQENLDATNAFFAKYTTPEEAKAIESRYGNDPVLTEMLYNLSLKSAEDRFRKPDEGGGGGADTTGSVEQLKGKLAAAQRSEAYTNTLHADHKRVDAEVKEISKKIAELLNKK